MKLSERINAKIAPPRSPFPSDIYDFLEEIKPEVAQLEARIVAEVKDGQAERSRCLQLEADKRLLMHVVHGRAMASSMPKHLKEE